MRWYDSIELTASILTLSRHSVLPPTEFTILRDAIVGYVYEGNTKVALTECDAIYKDFTLLTTNGHGISFRFYTMLLADGEPIYLESILCEMMECVKGMHPYLTKRIVQIPDYKKMNSLEPVEAF